ncbi:hypothetical protein HID58_087042 [Brassica napus]|uniref:Uncharacterized protein n=1 Tax=Brassica napus TaxID=3708 RepID=A0ABQ7XS84_BRANA|nr:hypothetical protein HID58_087042 [Brassica napus]
MLSGLGVPSCAELHLFGLGQSLVVFEVVFLVVGLPLLLPSRLGFQDMVFGDLTSIARGRLHDLMISFCLPFQLSFNPACVSVTLSLFRHIWKIVSGLKYGLMFLGGWLHFSLNHSLVVFEVVFLVVGLPLLLPSRLGFQDMVFGDLTSIARGRLHDLMISFCLPFQLSFNPACVSVTLSLFRHVCHSSVLLRVCSVDLEDCFWSQVWTHVSRGLASFLPQSCCSLLPLNFVVLPRHRRLFVRCFLPLSWWLCLSFVMYVSSCFVFG